MKYTLIYIFTFISLNSFSQNSSKLGQLLGEKTFKTLDSSIITIGKANDSGQYTLIDYYFAGCKPCNENLPKIEKLKAKFGNKLIVISINPVDSKSTVIEHKKKYNLNYTIIGGKDAAASKSYFGLQETPFGFPAYFLIDHKGILIFETMNRLGWKNKIAKLIK